MSYGYGNNPFDQRDNSPGGYGAPAGAYNSNPYAQQQPSGGYGRSDPYGQGQNMEAGYGGNSMEMSAMSPKDPNAILNECRDVDREIDQIESNLNQLRQLHQRVLEDVDSTQNSNANRQLDALSTDTMAQYRSLTERVRTIKSNPDSRSPKNSPQVGRVDRRLKAAIQQYQQIESSAGQRTRDQMSRQYRIVRPDASEAEVREAVENPQGQMFQQALMQSDRQGRATAALSAVKDRQAALLRIEQQMVELAQLFQDMDTLIVQQEPAVVQIDQKAEEIVDNLDKGNVEMHTAVETARATRKKKWWCLGISVLIVIVIIIIVVVVMAVQGKFSGGNDNNNNNNKRDLGEINILPIPADFAREGARVMARAIAEAPILRVIEDIRH